MKYIFKKTQSCPFALTLSESQKSLFEEFYYSKSFSGLMPTIYYSSPGIFKSIDQLMIILHLTCAKYTRFWTQIQNHWVEN